MMMTKCGDADGGSERTQGVTCCIVEIRRLLQPIQYMRPRRRAPFRLVVRLRPGP